MRGLDGEEEAKTAGVEIAVDVIQGVRALPASPASTSWLPGWATEAVPRVVRAAALDATAAG
jgi:hypothetical protein